MGLIATTPKSDPVPAGVHIAVCYSLVDMGTHLNPTYGKRARKVHIGWELPEERIELEREGKRVSLPRAISKRYTFSLHKKSALRADLKSWRGRDFTDAELEGFDLRNIVAKGCMLNVVHESSEGKTYANIQAVIPMRGAAPSLENPPAVFDLDEFMLGAEKEPPSVLPEWIRNEIKGSDEWKAKWAPNGNGNGSVAEDGSEVADDTPF